jgi:hypothetical protein
MQLLVFVLILLILVLPAASFVAGMQVERRRSVRNEKLDILDRMERAELSNRPELVRELGELYTNL